MFTNWLTPQNTPLPPDILLEIGPPPFTRFAAHSSLLTVHSGYLRAAIRPDDGQIITIDTPIYLPNITAEQFSPLLTYMYTGFLDLSIENIFGVLLATHVLHMPRALELCRTFLSRQQQHQQTDGSSVNYLSGNNTTINSSGLINNFLPNFSATENYNPVKIIRPIPSKAVGTGIGFISPPISHILLSSRDTSFKTITTNPPSTTTTTTSATTTGNINTTTNIESSTNLRKNIEKERERSPIPSTSKFTQAAATTEIFQHSRENYSSNKKQLKFVRKSRTFSSTSPAVEKQKDKIKSVVVPGSELINQEQQQREETLLSPQNDTKTIIDVASCDGPVRFRRVLNDAYGRTPSSTSITQLLPTTSASSTPTRTTSLTTITAIQETAATALNDFEKRQQNQLNLSNSFHQQMARNIIERNNLLSTTKMLSEESENSQDTNPNSLQQPYHHHHNHHHTNSHQQPEKIDEIFTCIYCKHTFKSQYCYQKHAKRHLNPLSIDNDNIIEITEGDEKDEKLQIATEPTIISTAIQIQTTTGIITPATTTSVTVSQPTGTIIINKREVRPLDMNVQYYPCKTCGSKFPSYYFVHKHRKLCHANEEN